MKRILVGDDSPTITTLLQTTLEGNGYEVATARNGLETYEMGVNAEFDLAIVDYLMPGLLGLEVIDRWRAEGVDMPVIVLTGVDDERTAIESLNRTSVDFVRKPFRVHELLARIRQRIPD